MNSGSVVIRPAEEYQRIHERLTLSPTRQTKIARDRDLGHRDGLDELSRSAAEVAKKIDTGTNLNDLADDEHVAILNTEDAINQRASDRSAVKSTLKPVFGGVRRVGNEILKKMEEIKSITQELEQESAEHQITADRKNSLHSELLAAEKFIEQKNTEINLLKRMLSETKNTTSAPAQKMTEIGVSNLEDSLDETKSRVGEMESKVKEQIENIKRSQLDQATPATPVAAQVEPQQTANTPTEGPEQINNEEEQIEKIHNELQALLTPAWNKYKYLRDLDLSTLLRDHKDDISKLATLTSEAENRSKDIFDEFNNNREYSDKAKKTLSVIYFGGKQSRRPFVSYLREINRWLDGTLKSLNSSTIVSPGANVEEEQTKSSVVGGIISVFSNNRHVFIEGRPGAKDEAIYNSFLKWKQQWISSGAIDKEVDKLKNQKPTTEQLKLAKEKLEYYENILRVKSEGKSYAYKYPDTSLEGNIIVLVKAICGQSELKNILIDLDAERKNLKDLWDKLRQEETRAATWTQAPQQTSAQPTQVVAQVAPVTAQATTTTQTFTTQSTPQISTTQQAPEPVPASTPVAEPTVAAVVNKQEAQQEKEIQALGRAVAAAVETIKRYRQSNPEATQKLIDVVYQLNVDTINKSSIPQLEKDALIAQLNAAKSTPKKEPTKPKVYGDAAARVEKLAAKTTGAAAKSEAKSSSTKTESKPEAKKFGLGSVAIATALGAAAALATPAILNNDKPTTNEAAAQPGESAPIKIGDMTLYAKDKYLLFTSGNVSTKLVFESVESGNGYYLAKMRSGDLIKNIAIPSQTTLPEFKAAADADSRLAVASTLADGILANNPIPGVTVLTGVTKKTGEGNISALEALSFKRQRQSGEVMEARHAAVEIKENPIAKEIFGKKYDQYVARFKDIPLAQFRRMSDEDIKDVRNEVNKIGTILSPFIKNGEHEASSVEELLNLASRNKIS